jgi:ubiquinone/menaquinone biosynthesis C-methylase UbiE
MVTNGPRSAAETYVGRGYPAHQQWFMLRRTAATNAGYLLPHLRPGMRLLDCGCGSGSVTAGLAAAVAPGEVVGLDLDPEQLAFARESAPGRGIARVRVVQGSVYALPFPDASFDAVHAHALLYHLREPLCALREVRRVLRSGGVAGVCDDETPATRVISPQGSALEEAADLAGRVMQHLRGRPSYQPRHLRGLLLEAGFTRAEGHAVGSESFGTPEATRQRAALVARLLTEGMVGRVAVEQGWADEASLADLAGRVRAWGERPDAFEASLYCAGLGWATATGTASAGQPR